MLVDVRLDEGDVAAYGKHTEKVRKDRWYLPARGYGGTDQELRRAQAAEAEFFDQAVAIYRRKADGMIGQRNRASYKGAAAYLARVRETLRRHGRREECNAWSTSSTPSAWADTTGRSIDECRPPGPLRKPGRR